MSYRSYDGIFESVRTQHNVMALVGNGFDIQILGALGVKMNTRYESFYYYLKSRNFPAHNLLLKVMEEQKAGGNTSWSDIESGISHLLEENVPVRRIEQSLSAIQSEFSAFLDGIVTPEVLSRLDSRVTRTGAAIKCLTEFLADVLTEHSYHKLSFIDRMDIYDLLSFRFVNFNYTPLLDNYLYLDKNNYEPRPHRFADRNFDFKPNPHGFDHSIGLRGKWMSSYVVNEVVHPHGVQHTPRSMLIGVDAGPSPRSTRLSKSYWGQYEVNHGSYVSETHLFVIFGCSLGESDGWWWRRIAERVVPQLPDDDASESEPADLIIYWWTGPTRSVEIHEDDVLINFANVAGKRGDQEFLDRLRERVVVILYGDDTPRIWLNLPSDDGAMVSH